MNGLAGAVEKLYKIGRCIMRKPLVTETIKLPCQPRPFIFGLLLKKKGVCILTFVARNESYTLTSKNVNDKIKIAVCLQLKCFPFFPYNQNLIKLRRALETINEDQPCLLLI